MLKFLVEKIAGNLLFDFERELVNSKEFATWRNQNFLIKYTNENGEIPNLKHPESFVPVGSIEFVQEYNKRYFPNHTEGLKPLNVPEELMKFSGRNIVNIPLVGLTDTEIHKMLKTFTSQLYVKSNFNIKDENNGILYNLLGVPVYGCQVSSYIDNILSEWRVFVFKDQVQQVCFYNGDPLIFPNSGRIIQMIDTYKDKSPVAYTLDVFTSTAKTHNGIEYTETYVMECHRFFSCGLYGFADYSKLPYMFSQTWYEMINL